VGIGTNAPQRQLHIKGANPRILIEAASISPEVNFKNSDDAGPETWALYKHGTTDDFRFYQSGDKVTIQNSTGYVGIGTTDPGMILDVDGHIRLRPGGFANSGIWLADNSAVDQWYLGMTNITMTNQLGFYKDSWLMVIDSSGHVGIGTQGPVNKLDVAGGMAVGSGYSGTSTAPANGMIIEGRVGIGTDSPSIQNKLEVTGGSSYNIYTTWSGVSSGAAISATNSGTGGDAIQVEASGSGRSALWARGSSGIDYTIYSADNGATYAGYFDGDLHFSGTMTGGTKSFLIDHPLDPLNKTLMHYCIESPEPLLVYSGKAKTDGAGRAVVQMPDYFAALTKEDQARINLTPVGRPFLIGAEWNAGNTSFTVYGDPNREVFYTVYADRDDPVMRQLKRPVVAEKGSGYFEKGKLLYPEAYGYSASMGVDYVNDRDSELP
jgi:hypothetical protein